MSDEVADFGSAAGELERWLATDNSRTSGQKPSSGGESGRRIVALKPTCAR
ncbi:hypothetical protein Ais01nite_60010 [Asanoa ishikariensis]|uniref:Uncharacterized protein n=1 Tax=Asanoa ishikariensis TaxID=137265 RepID=A0A1H3PBK9_9ACTN|nr:DUF3140 domain-containing protein [Asanoa ishikariensis]GIF67966.1 hypothetical protein Ais01nite_60010 [Asanoa ishikariensis]SDY98195.1 Protein of unknown function [Asanoa ishikariensis]